MSILFFVWHYIMALSFIRVPSEWALYYAMGMIVYLFVYFAKASNVNPYRDVHPFVIGFSSVWLVEILPIGEIEYLFVTLLLLFYGYLLYREKKSEELGLFSKNQLGRSAVYGIIVPFSVFLTTLYLTEIKEVAFVLYYASLFYGLYSSRFMMRFKGYMGFLLVNASLILLYTYQYLDISLVEKMLYFVLLIGAVSMTRVQEKKRFARGT